MGGETRTGLRLGRYVLHDQIGAGGMATMHLGHVVGPRGFGRTVAIKRLHPHLAGPAGSTGGGAFVAMLLDEARMAARVRHPNVAGILDVVSHDEETLLVLEYVHGESLAQLLRLSPGGRAPVGVVKALLVGALHGLHAAHEAVDERGAPLGMVHRDVSPQNILVGVDGVARLVDFGVAKARGRVSETSEGQLKGKLAYMAPEQVEHGTIDRRTDVFAAAIVGWEALTGQPLFAAENEILTFRRVLAAEVPAPSELRGDVDTAFDQILLRALSRDAALRFPTAQAMADAIERSSGLATVTEVSDWFEKLAGDRARERARRIVEIESGANGADPDSANRALASVPTPAPPGPFRPARAAMLTLGLLGVVSVAAMIELRRTSSAPSSAAATAHDASPAATAEVPGALVLASTAATPPSTATLAVTAAADPAPASSSSAPAARTRPPRPSAAAAGRAAPSVPVSGDPTCTFAAYVEADGTKRYQRVCP